MADQNSESEKEISQPGDSTKRMVLFLFGVLFAVLAIATAIEAFFGFAALLGLPALVFYAITLWGNSKTVATAKAFTDITYPP